MPKFRKKPVIIQAEQLYWENWPTICEFIDVGKLSDSKPEGCYIDADGRGTHQPTDVIGLWIPTLEGLMLARQGDWIIKGVQGEVYPCKPDIFAETYELIAARGGEA